MAERSFVRAPRGFSGCFGHRGAAGIFPENTLEGFALAARIGVDVIETDAHLTRDGHVVLIHDPTVDRTTEGVGEIAAMTLAELRALDAGSRWTDASGATVYKGCGLRIPTLIDALEMFSEHRFNIELKSAVPGAAKELASVLDRGGARGRVLLASEDDDTMKDLRRHAPWAPTSCSSAEAFGFLTGMHEDAYEPPPACALQVPDVFNDFEVVTEAFIARAKRFDMAVHVWLCNDPASMQRMIALGCDAVFTDHPERWALRSSAALR